MVAMGSESFRISSRGWTPRGHRIWAVFSEKYPDQVAIISIKQEPRVKYDRYDEFVRCHLVVDRLPWDPIDPDDPLQLEIMKRRYPKEDP